MPLDEVRVSISYDDGSKLIINLEKEYQRMVDDSLMMWNNDTMQ
jgi:hypothetical protein